MKSKYPYLDPELIKITKEWLAPLQYNPTQSNEELARSLAFQAGKMEILAKLETIVKLQEKEQSRGV